MDEVIQIGVERPCEVALISALEDAIEGIAPGNMTPAEVLGCLDIVAKRFYNDFFDIYE